MPDFDDLLAANRAYADSFAHTGLEGAAAAGVGIVTCMDSRIDPLAILGLGPGDAKILRNPGGQVTDHVLTALALAVNLLKVDRILVIEHTRCAMASASEAELQSRVTSQAGADASWMSVGVIDDQATKVRKDVAAVKAHPLIGDHVAVAGFIYDVDTGLLTPID